MLLNNLSLNVIIHRYIHVYTYCAYTICIIVYAHLYSDTQVSRLLTYKILTAKYRHWWAHSILRVLFGMEHHKFAVNPHPVHCRLFHVLMCLCISILKYIILNVYMYHKCIQMSDNVSQYRMKWVCFSCTLCHRAVVDVFELFSLFCCISNIFDRDQYVSFHSRFHLFSSQQISFIFRTAGVSFLGFILYFPGALVHVYI